MKPLPLVLVLLAAHTSFVCADVKLPAVFSDHMVLEKTAKVPVWGKAEPGEEVSVTLDGQTVKATASAEGQWKAILNLQDSKPGPFEMIVQGKNQIKIADVVVGEVWVASGQSNMAWSLKTTANSAEEIAASANPMLREFQIRRATSMDPKDDCEGVWTVASPSTSGGFSAVGYFFSKALNKELNTPVGWINTSWGGTPAEAWTSADAFNADPDLKASKDKFLAAVKEYPGKKQTFVDKFGAWLKETGREDKPPAEAATFAGPDISTEDWAKVKIPGAVQGIGLPQAGAIWVRRTVDLPGAPAKLNLVLGAFEAFDRVYWNGGLVAQTPYQDYPGVAYPRTYEVPANLVKQGTNVLAVRIYEPVAPAVFAIQPRVNGINLGGEWLAKTEYEFPSLDAKQASAPKPPGNPTALQHMPAHLFNAMINPVIPYAIRGVIWYQGEANASRAWQYRTTFPLMISDWRKLWNQGDFPFYFCQLAAYQPKKPAPGDSAWAELRDAQSSALKLPNTGQAILLDIGESADIHPANKKDVGERLAKIALARDYGKSIPYSGPVFDSAKVEGSSIRVKFTNAEGLTAKPLPATYDVKTSSKETAPLQRNSPQSEVEGFAICGADKKWAWADAKIDGDSVIVSSAQVTTPVAVRYAWADHPTCNLTNASGLPASPFRTDDFPASTLSQKY